MNPLSKLISKTSLWSKSLLCAGLFSVALNTYAVEMATGVYIAPSLSYEIYDKDRTYANPVLVGGQVLTFPEPLDDGFGFNLGLGYQFGQNWAVELGYLETETSIDGPSGGDVDRTYIHLDGLYHFEDHNDNGWSPYMVFGLGHSEFEDVRSTSTDKDTEFNAGAGYKYAFNSNFHLRADARLMFGLDDVDLGTLFNVGFVYNFGEAKESKPKMEAPVPVVEPVKQPVVVLDTDKDGILDDMDKCPRTVKGIVVDANGCNVDKDSDGVVNGEDKCPNTKAGAKVDNEGCYLVLKEPKEFTLDVKFKSGSSQLEASSQRSIAGLAKFLETYPNTKVVIEGHSDSQGAAAFNKTLSQNRADSVKSSLVNSYGVDEQRIRSVGYGEEQPVADNATAAGRQQNRRVVARVKTKA